MGTSSGPSGEQLTWFHTTHLTLLPDSLVVAKKQCPASVMVWAAVTESGRSALFFVDQGVKFNKENYRDELLVGALLP